MSSSTLNLRSKNPSMYAASVNPPRRAKLQALPALLPSPPASTSPSSTTAPLSSSCLDSLQAEQPRKRRGRKPAIAGMSTSSRASREAARKANHSRIEKARRGKINNALEELKSLVPQDFVCAEDKDEICDEEDEHAHLVCPAKRDSGKKASSDRDFKLDILERTVLFVRSLLHRLDEAERCPVSGSSLEQRNKEVEDTKKENEKKRSLSISEGRNQHSKRRRKSLISSPVDNEEAGLSETEDDDDGYGTEADSGGDECSVEESHVASSPWNAQKETIRLPSISELLSSADSIASRPKEAEQLPSPSLSPYLSPHHYRHARRSLTTAATTSQHPSPSPLMQLSPSMLSGASTHTFMDPKHSAQTRAARDIDLELPGVSCPIGMSYLLTPPEHDIICQSMMANPSAPTFSLPSSALGAPEGFEKDLLVNKAPEDDELDRGAHTATLALLQMRDTRYTKAGRAARDPATENRPGRREVNQSLTPGNLLGIETRR